VKSAKTICIGYTAWILKGCATFVFALLIPIVGHGQTAYTFPTKPITSFTATGADAHCGEINVTTTDFSSAFAALQAYTFACPYASTLFSDSCSIVDPSGQPSGERCQFIYNKREFLDLVGGFVTWTHTCSSGAHDPASGMCVGTTSFNAPKNNHCPVGPISGGTNPCNIATGNKYQIEFD
jgi:hypothetical protein